MSEQAAAAEKTIVIGVDGTGPSLEALTSTAAVAAALAVRVVVVFVRHLPPLAADPASGQAIAAMGDALDELEQETRDAAKEVLDKAGVPYVFERRVGDPGHEIIESAHEHNASLVVVGATIHGAVSSLLLSSVAEHLVHHCDVSLVIVRPKAAA